MFGFTATPHDLFSSQQQSALYKKNGNRNCRCPRSLRHQTILSPVHHWRWHHVHRRIVDLHKKGNCVRHIIITSNDHDVCRAFEAYSDTMQPGTPLTWRACRTFENNFLNRSRLPLESFNCLLPWILPESMRANQIQAGEKICAVPTQRTFQPKASATPIIANTFTL